MKKIIFTRPEDGGVSIVCPAPKSSIEQMVGSLTDEQYEALVMERSIPENAINVREIEDTDFPTVDGFRDAWEDGGDKININLIKAKDINLGRLRQKRDSLLDTYDKLLARAMEIGTEQEVDNLKTKKQQLRDATEPLKALTNPTSIDEIIQLTPSLDEY